MAVLSTLRRVTFLGSSWRGAVIFYSIFQHLLVGDLILVAEEDRLIRSSYVDSKLAPSVGVDWVREPKHAQSFASTSWRKRRPRRDPS